MAQHHKRLVDDFVQVEVIVIDLKGVALHLGKVQKVKHKCLHHLRRKHNFLQLVFDLL